MKIEAFKYFYYIDDDVETYYIASRNTDVYGWPEVANPYYAGDKVRLGFKVSFDDETDNQFVADLHRTDVNSIVIKISRAWKWEESGQFEQNTYNYEFTNLFGQKTNDWYIVEENNQQKISFVSDSQYKGFYFQDYPTGTQNLTGTPHSPLISIPNQNQEVIFTIEIYKQQNAEDILLRKYSDKIYFDKNLFLQDYEIQSPKELSQTIIPSDLYSEYIPTTNDTVTTFLQSESFQINFKIKDSYLLLDDENQKPKIELSFNLGSDNILQQFFSFSTESDNDYLEYDASKNGDFFNIVIKTPDDKDLREYNLIRDSILALPSTSTLPLDMLLRLYNINGQDASKKDLTNLNRIYLKIKVTGVRKIQEENGKYEVIEFGPYQFPESENLEKIVSISNSIMTSLPVSIEDGLDSSISIGDSKIKFTNAEKSDRFLSGFQRSENVFGLTPDSSGSDYDLYTIPASWSPESCIGIMVRNYGDCNTYFRARQWGVSADMNLLSEGTLEQSFLISFFYLSGDDNSGSDYIDKFKITNIIKYRLHMKFIASKDAYNAITYKLAVPKKITGDSQVDNHSWPQEIYLLCI